ncbi:hypothetical protein [Robertmurraya sp. FSL R5-0851]|uniref:hypothetical protein n=1 Tax=Robertmurraya sp. FSL R5-0851 TaxID=2921584 RepID=UPI0030F85372
MVKVLIAVGDKSYTDILTETFSQHTDYFTLSSQEVLHRRFLEEIVELEKPDMLVIHDYYLESDFTRDEMKEQELATFFRKLRVEYDDSIRIVFLCERPKGDPFLSSLVSMGILDIFNSNAFDLDEFIQQLKDKPRFAKVEKFLVSIVPHTTTIPVAEEEVNEDEEAEEDSPKKDRKEKTEKQVVQKVIEKKVVQKVVNKNVIKRDYTVQVHNHTEKIVGIPIKKKLVMIGSPIQRSGSTFVSHLLARTLTQMGVPTTYVESPFSNAYTYDRFFGTEHASDYRSKFYQFSKYIDPKVKSVFDWNKFDVDIICKHPTNEPVYQEDEVAFESLIKVLFSSSSSVTIMDVGTDWEYELFQDVFDIADHVYFVFEPDIPFIQYFEETKDDRISFMRDKLSSEKSAIIGNRFDKPTLESALIQDMYKDKIITSIPVFPVKEVFQAQLEGKFLNEYKESQKRMELHLQPLLEEILPGEFLKKHRKGTGLFKGLFNKNITIEKKESKLTEGEEQKI